MLERARRLLLVAFAVSGLLIFSWLARLPSVRDALQLSATELGGYLLVGSIGALITVFSSSTLLNRFGSARVFAVGSVVMSAGFALMGIGPALGSRELFLMGIVVNGIGGALINLPMNVESARIEQAYGRTIIPHFHAAFSAGAVLGSLLGAAASSAGMVVWLQFTLVAILIGAVRLAILSNGLVLPGGVTARPGQPTSSPMAAWLQPRTVLIGMVAFAAALSEGAANNWLALAFVDGFDSPEAAGGLALGVFIASMTLVRAFGTGMIDRLGRTLSLQISGVFAVIGLALFGLSTSPASAVVGVALWGIGAALCFPIAVAAASEEPQAAAARVSVVASLGSVAAMTAAPLVGFAAAQLGGPQHALLIVLFALVLSLAVSRHVGPVVTTEVADPLADLERGVVQVA
ncbi:MAG: MFS transporter [Propionicimonas sp.]